MKLFGSNKRLNGSLTRSGSMKYIPHKSGTLLTDSSSSTEYTTSQDYQPLSTSKSKRERECVRARVRVRVIPETEIVKKKFTGFVFVPEKTSLLARLFRRSGRKRGLSAPPTIHTFSAQFPPAEWFNPKVIHMHCVGTQTKVSSVGKVS